MLDIFKRLSRVFRKAEPEEVAAAPANVASDESANATAAEPANDASDKRESTSDIYYDMRARVEMYLAGLPKHCRWRTTMDNLHTLGWFAASLADGDDFQVLGAYEIISTNCYITVHDIDDINSYALVQPFFSKQVWDVGAEPELAFTKVQAAAIVMHMRIDQAQVDVIMHLQSQHAITGEGNPFIFLKINTCILDVHGCMLASAPCGYVVDVEDQSGLVRLINRRRLEAMDAQIHGLKLNPDQRAALDIPNMVYEYQVATQSLKKGKLETTLRHALRMYEYFNAKYLKDESRTNRQLLGYSAALLGEIYLYKGLFEVARYYLTLADTMPNVTFPRVRELLDECVAKMGEFPIVPVEESALPPLPSKVGMLIRNYMELGEDEISDCVMIRHSNTADIARIKGLRAEKGAKALEFEYLRAAAVLDPNIVAIRTREGSLHLISVTWDVSGYARVIPIVYAHIDDMSDTAYTDNFCFNMEGAYTMEEFLEMRNEASELVLESKPVAENLLATLGVNADAHYNFLLGLEAGKRDNNGDFIYYMEKAYRNCARLPFSALDHFDMHMLHHIWSQLSVCYARCKRLPLGYELMSHLQGSDRIDDKITAMTFLSNMHDYRAFQIVHYELAHINEHKDADYEELVGYHRFLCITMSVILEEKGMIAESKRILNPLLVDEEEPWRRRAYDRLQILLDKYPDE